MRKTHEAFSWIGSAATIVALSLTVDSPAVAAQLSDVIGCELGVAQTYLKQLGYKTFDRVGKDGNIVLRVGLTSGEYEPVVLEYGVADDKVPVCPFARVPKLIGDNEYQALAHADKAGFQVDTRELPKGARVANQEPSQYRVEPKGTVIVVSAPTPTTTATTATTSPPTTEPPTTSPPTTEPPTTAPPTTDPPTTDPPTTPPPTTDPPTTAPPTTKPLTTTAKTSAPSGPSSPSTSRAVSPRTTPTTKPATSPTRTTRAARQPNGARPTTTQTTPQANTTVPSSAGSSSVPTTTSVPASTTIAPTSTSVATPTTAPRPKRGGSGGHLTLTGPVAALSLATGLGLVGVHRARTTRSALRSQLDAHLTRDSDLHVSGGDLGLVAWLDPPEITTVNEEFPS